MKKRIGIIIVVLIVTIIITVIGIVKKNSHNKDIMQIKASTLTKTSATIVIKNKKEYSIGEAFKVEAQVNNEWKEVNTLKIKDIPEDIATFTAIATKVKANSEYEEELDWSKMYGELKEGKYRVVKEISNEDGKKYLYAEFNI